jgi:hypothetical protein
VEPVTKGATPGSTITDEAKKGRQVPPTVRLTINTAAVWRDWARDQATEDVTKSASKDAEEGQNSVATKGQPATADTTVLVDVGPDTRVETRFRSPTDETTKGAAPPNRRARKTTRRPTPQIQLAGREVEIDGEGTTLRGGRPQARASSSRRNTATCGPEPRLGRHGDPPDRWPGHLRQGGGARVQDGDP